MASQSQGIQQLLQAEKRAAEKVAEARKREYGSVGLREGRLGPHQACRGLGLSVQEPVAVAGPVGSSGRVRWDVQKGRSCGSRLPLTVAQLE